MLLGFKMKYNDDGGLDGLCLCLCKARLVLHLSLSRALFVHYSFKKGGFISLIVSHLGYGCLYYCIWELVSGSTWSFDEKVYLDLTLHQFHTITLHRIIRHDFN